MVRIVNAIENTSALLDSLSRFDIWPSGINEVSISRCQLDENNLLMLETEGGIVRGYVFGYLLSKLAGTVAVLDSIEVLPDFQRHGIGKTLMVDFFNYSLNIWNAGHISLLVNPGNDRAISLYKGFQSEQHGYFFNGEYELKYLTWEINEK